MLCACIWNDTTIVIERVTMITWPCPHCHRSKLKKEVLCKDRNNVSLNLVAFCYVLYYHPVSSCTPLLVRYTWWWIKMKEWSHSSFFSQMVWKKQSNCMSSDGLTRTMSVRNVDFPPIAPRLYMCTWKPNTCKPPVLSALSVKSIALLETPWTSTNIATIDLFNKSSAREPGEVPCRKKFSLKQALPLK